VNGSALLFWSHQEAQPVGKKHNSGSFIENLEEKILQK